MPKGPKGKKRPADVIGAGVQIAKIATGEIEEDLGKTDDGKDRAAVARGRKGDTARAENILWRDTSRRTVAVLKGGAMHRTGYCVRYGPVPASELSQGDS